MGREKFEGLEFRNPAERSWAEDLLKSNTSLVGGGMSFAMYISSLKSRKGFKEFEPRWKAWWSKVGQKKYAKKLEENEREFHKEFVKDSDGVYCHRGELKEQLERELTLAEIKWVKKLYRNRKAKK